MPAKRQHRTRNRLQSDLSAAEVEWLSGEPQVGANKFWIHGPGGAERIARCRGLIERYRLLIPEGRLPVLEQDIKERWTPMRARGNGHADH